MKHPPAHPDTSILSPPEEPPDISVSEEDVLGAIKSFPNGSAGGPDGLRQQHIKDLIHSPKINGNALTSVLAHFVTMVLKGLTHLSIHPLFFGASLTVLTKEHRRRKQFKVGGGGGAHQ